MTITATSSPSAAGRARRVYHLISADSHINEPPDLWLSRMPASLRDRAPRMEQFDEGDAWIFEGVAGPMPIGLNACAGLESRLRSAWVRYDEIRSGGHDPAARLGEIDRDGVDAEVLYPTPRLFQAVYATDDRHLHLALVQAYNDWIDEYASYDLERFRALPVLPNRGVDDAVAEIERVGQRPSTGGFLIGAYPGGTLQPRAEDDPVFAALTERGLPLHIHVALNTTMPATTNTNALPAASRFTAMTGHLVDLIFSGVLERFPDLAVVAAEVDCGWVPYYKEQMDDGFMRYRHRYDLNYLPSEYVERQVHFTFVTDTYGIDNRHRVGVDRILWSSDYPHGSANWPNTWPAVQASMSGVAVAERDKILVGNAVRLYGFGR